MCVYAVTADSDDYRKLGLAVCGELSSVDEIELAEGSFPVFRDTRLVKKLGGTSARVGGVGDKKDSNVSVATPIVVDFLSPRFCRLN